MMNNVPKLRFKEFSEEWEEKKLGDVAIINPKPKKLPENFYYIDLESVNKGLLTKLNLISKVDAPSRAKRLLSKNDILFQTVRPYQQNNYLFNLSNAYVASTGYAQIRAKESTKFLYHKLHTNKFVNSVMLRCTGTSYPAINSTDLLSVIFYLPSKPEQQKIASFLTSIDTKIEQLTKKEELLKQYKKGVMQKIFSQEIRFRADDGSEFFEWEKKKLRDVAIKKSNKNKANSINRVFTNSAQYGIVDQRDFFDKDIANQNNLKGYYIVNKDDFIYNPRISNSAPVGPIKRNKLGQGVMSPLYTVLEFKQKYRDFYEFYFKTTLWHRYMYQIANFGARFDRMNITNSDFMKMPLPLPSLAEQTKIANFLSSIDDKIKQAQKHLNATKEFKKALLQQMFV